MDLIGRQGRRTLAGFTIALFSLTSAAAAPPLLHGFSDLAAASERRNEAGFLSIPSAAEAMELAKVVGAQAHPAGSDGDYALATYVREQFAKAGFDSTIEPVKAALQTPAKLTLEIGPRAAFAVATRGRIHDIGRKRIIGFDLRETGVSSDADTMRTDAGVPFAYGSADGDVAAPLVYVNYGRDEDYNLLRGANIDVRGTIALARIGMTHQSEIAAIAARNGAAGVVFYNDPKDDGFGAGPVYPNGPWRPDGSIARALVSNGSLHIPALPVSAKTAAALLATVKGVPAAASWTGGIPQPYTLGRSTDYVHLQVKLTRKTGDIWNNIATLPGKHPNQFVILGAHRDAWAYGVSENGSGVITLLEVARGLGYLYANGWRPERSIVLAGWDGKEIGEVGSHAYVTRHAVALREGCVAYVNADGDVTGPNFSASAAAALNDVVISATRSVIAPEPGAMSLYDRWLATQRERDPHRSRPAIGWPGGGSDFDAFLFGLGVPVADFGFRGPFGAADSIYDDFNYATTQADPGFVRHRTAAQFLGIVAMRLADANAIPYDFVSYSQSLRAALEAMRSKMRMNRFKVNTNMLQGAIARFSGATYVAGAWPANDSGAVNERALNVAKVLDATLYGANGNASTVFPVISSALDRADPTDAADAVKTTTLAIDHATSLLGH